MSFHSNNYVLLDKITLFLIKYRTGTKNINIAASNKIMKDKYLSE